MFYQAEQRARESRERSLSPVDIAGDEFNAGQRAFVDSVRSRGGRIVVVTHPRTANNHKELTVVRGEYLEVSQVALQSVAIKRLSLLGKWQELMGMPHRIRM